MIDADPEQPAFPRTYSSDGHNGMSLRDFFAAQAVAGGFARETVPEYDLKALFGPHRTAIRREEIIAADAYRIADAMLKARTVTPAEGNTP
jgi:hypothetical protein